MRTTALAFAFVTTGACTARTDSTTIDMQALPSETMGTVVTLSWDAEACPGASTVVTLVPDDGDAVGSEVDGETQLLGLVPATDYEFTVELTVDGQVCRQGAGTFRTGETALDAPGIVTTGEGIDGYFVTSLLTLPSGPVIFNGDGDMVWGFSDQAGDGPVVSRALLTPDRRSVVYGSYWLYPDDGAKPVNDIVRVSIDGEHVVRTPTLRMHHDFLMRPDGGMAYLGAETRRVDGFPDDWRADLLVEVDPDGTERVLWNAWEEFPWGEDDEPLTPVMIHDREWTHANALVYSESEDAYFVSVRDRSCILKIDAKTGERIWTMGGRHSDFEMTSGDWFIEQHQFRVNGDELLVFDNGSHTSLSSRAVRLRFDEEARTVEQTWTYFASPPTFVYVLGDVEDLPNEDTLVTWSTSGELELVAPDDTTRWRMSVDIGNIIGYVQYLEDLRPADE